MNETEKALEAARARIAANADVPPAERFERLVRAGIITRDGQLSGSISVTAPAPASEPNGSSNGKR